jgi:hypothetical protein
MADVWFQTGTSPASLGSQASALAQAIGTHLASGTAPAAPAGGLSMPGQTGLAGGLAAALGNFDANGKLRGDAAELAGSEHTRAIGAAQPGGAGMLAMGK